MACIGYLGSFVALVGRGLFADWQTAEFPDKIESASPLHPRCSMTIAGDIVPLIIIVLECRSTMAQISNSSSALRRSSHNDPAELTAATESRLDGSGRARSLITPVRMIRLSGIDLSIPRHHPCGPSSLLRE